MDPVVGAMEVALINSTIGILLAKLNTMIEKDKKLRKELKRELHDIKCEMVMIKEAVKMHAQSKHLRWWILEIQDLAYDIEDSIDEFKDRVTCPPEAGFLARKLHSRKTMATRARFAEQIQDLKERARNAYKRKDTYLAGAAAPASELQPAGPSSLNSYVPEDELVGIAEPKQELRRLLEFAAAGAGGKGGEAPEQLRVISIVGCRGIGKTTLAKVVFDSFDDVTCRAWVVASGCKNARALLEDIYSKLPGEKEDDANTGSSFAKLAENLSTHLGKQKMYLIVIDDIQTEVWETVKFSFPTNKNGRIIVTTSIQSIAEDWISHGGYVYKMQALDEVHSRALLLKQVNGSCIESSWDFGGSEVILKKCDGLPLAIVNIAQLLKKPNSRTCAQCTKMCRNLGAYLQDGTLPTMKDVLIHSYDTLPGHDLKTCLLSVSIFPENHQIKRKSLIRRWLAEGLVVKDVRRDPEDVACDYFEKLIDRNVIQPLHTSNNAAVKTCQVHGIVLDFIVHKSASENFIAFVHNNELIACKEASCNVRRLALHKSTAKTVEVVRIDLSRIRSLTIFDHVGVYIDFEKCKLLRVLDLEKCKELKESDILNICKLMQLKYLSLRGTNVTEIPREISNLQYLETLDTRDTNVSILPIEVFNLPGLAHLFGRFKLPCELNQVRKGHKWQTFFSQKSRLQTLAGFVIDENCGFQHIILHISKLKKVKVWSEGTPSRDSLDLLSASLQKRFFGTDALQSLSIDFGNRSIDFLDSLTIPCVLTSVRLQGRLTKLPDFIKSLNDLELHLSSSALSNECLLALQRLNSLLYLKLVEYGSEFVDRKLSIQSNGFPRLQRLCIQAQNKLPEMYVEERAMQCLTSLQLLCEDISGFPLDYIRHIEGLKEVTLVSTISPDKRKAWEKELKMHKNRPEIITVTPTTPAI